MTFLTPTTNAITPTKKVATTYHDVSLAYCSRFDLKIAGLLGGTPEPELLDTDRGTEEWLTWPDTCAARIESEKAGGEWGEDFDEAQEMAVMAANPRFVLRQWLLEEVIKKVEHSLETGKEHALVLSAVVPARWLPRYPRSQIRHSIMCV
ncbi:hypothetical protein EDD15DRAFT_2441272 [Pisolithus albus]|nr:hypothetical protein EDD15DRAFT_2441272 [Pisolithus albus]